MLTKRLSPLVKPVDAEGNGRTRKPTTLTIPTESELHARLCSLGPDLFALLEDGGSSSQGAKAAHTIAVMKLPVNDIKSINGIERFSKLRILDLSVNMIDDTCAFQHSQCPNLVSLTLSRNRLTSTVCVKGLRTLLHLDLSMNRLTSSSGLSHLSKLESLTLDDNAITQISGFRTMTSLTSLSMQRNRLTAIGQDLSVSLCCLNLAGAPNDIRGLVTVSGDLARLSKLQDINLQGNGVCQESFYQWAMVSLPSLCYLDLVSITTPLRSQISEDGSRQKQRSQVTEVMADMQKDYEFAKRQHSQKFDTLRTNSDRRFQGGLQRLPTTDNTKSIEPVLERISQWKLTWEHFIHASIAAVKIQAMTRGHLLRTRQKNAPLAQIGACSVSSPEEKSVEPLPDVVDGIPLPSFVLPSHERQVTSAPLPPSAHHNKVKATKDMYTQTTLTNEYVRYPPSTTTDAAHSNPAPPTAVMVGKGHHISAAALGDVVSSTHPLRAAASRVSARVVGYEVSQQNTQSTVTQHQSNTGMGRQGTMPTSNSYAPSPTVGGRAMHSTRTTPTPVPVENDMPSSFTTPVQDVDDESSFGPPSYSHAPPSSTTAATAIVGQGGGGRPGGPGHTKFTPHQPHAGPHGFVDDGYYVRSPPVVHDSAQSPSGVGHARAERSPDSFGQSPAVGHHDTERSLPVNRSPPVSHHDTGRSPPANQHDTGRSPPVNCSDTGRSPFHRAPGSDGGDGEDDVRSLPHARRDAGAHAGPLSPFNQSSSDVMGRSPAAHTNNSSYTGRASPVNAATAGSLAELPPAGPPTTLTTAVGIMMKALQLLFLPSNNHQKSSTG